MRRKSPFLHASMVRGVWGLFAEGVGCFVEEVFGGGRRGGGRRGGGVV